LAGWLAGVPASQHLLLDQSAELAPVWKFFSDWGMEPFAGHPFIWCSMSSMGGNLGLYGDMEIISTGPFDGERVLPSLN
jgi:alpha-N-acetylglucosaminidase